MGLDIPRVALLTGHKTWAMLRRYTEHQASRRACGNRREAQKDNRAGCSRTSMTETNAAATPRRYPAPNWDRWRDVPRGTAFECAALSCDIEPWVLTEAGRATLTSPGRISDLNPPMNVNPVVARRPHTGPATRRRRCFSFGMGSRLPTYPVEGPVHPDRECAHTHPNRCQLVRWRVRYIGGCPRGLR